MATKSQVEIALVAAKERFVESNDNDIKKLQEGCGCCKDKNTQCLYFLKEALQDRYDMDVYDQTTDDLVHIIDNLIGSGATGVSVEWGYFDNQPDPLIPIPFQFTQDIMGGTSSFSMEFTLLADTKWLAVRELATEPVKTSWYNTPFNNGVIPDQVWLAPQIIGAYRYYISRGTTAVDDNPSIITFSTH